MKLQIRLLGTVELWVDGQIVTPGAAKRRAVLAGLALEANHAVSLPRLAEMVWPETPPASAVANLRTHAAMLRRVLGDRLVARPNAYELRLAPGELDVAEFQRLAGEGRALASVESAEAITALNAALSCWRGPSGDGLPRGTALDNRWTTLEEQRLQVFEELADARLAAGQHGQLLPELRRHLAAHPLRERAWGQLMLALYRCGDVPAALTVFRHARTVLHEQLAIEPGDELAGLHRAMLDRAPELAYVPAAASTVVAPAAQTRPNPGWTVPRELPATPATFVGRTRETAQVVAALSSAPSAAVVVAGAAGSGKTALVVRAAHTVAGDFPDGQVFVDLGYDTTMTPSEVLARVLRALGVPSADIPGNSEERAGWFRSLVAGRRLLLVVDGATRANQVRPLLPAGPGPALVVVGQRHLSSLDGVRRVTLHPLGAVPARDLLAAFAGPERLVADPAAAAELARLCAGSVLALRIVGSRLAGCPAMPVAGMVRELRDGPDRLDLLAYEDLSVRASLAAGVAAVRSDDEVAGRLLELLATQPDHPALLDHAAAQLGVSTRRLRRALEGLVDAHLIDRVSAGGYSVPALVRDYAVELALPPTQTGPLPRRRGHPPVAA
ncbi:BTAD domain-containing putative transcriptional regulator [Micromonospora sp. CA-246542]|uniref:AfsR/SARP family transcriptional regulator n=1 Tax=Micromonospora sp. CA-246542 TaxID=3239959 RepID=UPI003D92F349